MSQPWAFFTTIVSFGSYANPKFISPDKGMISLAKAGAVSLQGLLELVGMPSACLTGEGVSIGVVW